MNDENITNASELYDIVETIIGLAMHNPLSVAKIAAFLSDNTYTAIQKIPYLQIKKYLDGVKKVEEELGNACKLSDKLFSDSKKKNENAMRIYKIVTSTDTEKKIDYLINATRSMLMGVIDTSEMFRIFRAIVDSLPEDLDYLSAIVEKGGPFTGNIQILALERSGLMISAGIDANADVEKQQYHITALGFSVDKYALSFSNEERWKWHTNVAKSGDRKFIGPASMSEEIEAIFNEQKQEIIDSVQPKWESINSDEHFGKIQSISQRREAVVLLVCATKTGGRLSIGQDLSHFNPYVEIGKYMLPEDDNSRESATWVDAVKILENKGMLECVNFQQKMYRLTSDGWKEADVFIELNDLQENDIINPNELIKILQ